MKRMTSSRQNHDIDTISITSKELLSSNSGKVLKTESNIDNKANRNVTNI